MRHFAGGVGLLAGAALLATLLVGANRPADRTRTGVGEPPPAVHPNDNRIPAGRLRGDTLDLRLEVRMATWRPEGDSGAAIEVPAFAEVDRAPEIPAPLIRVPAGTIITATVRNALSD
ncbi:MAG TPA: hypothetical protein VFT84_02110, partial [Gemmatimonadales bacterium]|nr:hypothetical protein [Gemmatimonadales bacterium]